MNFGQMAFRPPRPKAQIRGHFRQFKSYQFLPWNRTNSDRWISD